MPPSKLANKGCQILRGDFHSHGSTKVVSTPIAKHQNVESQTLNTVIINGVTYSGHGSITVVNGRVTIGGKDVTPEGKDIYIVVNGDVQSLSVDACHTINVTGDVGDLSTQSGDVKCGDVAGCVQSMSGDVSCGAVRGSVKTMSGDITHH